MSQNYNQFRAMMAISKASLKAMLRNPSALVFGFAFPLIFILVFGFIGNSGGGPVYTIAIDKSSDTTNALYDSLVSSKNIRINNYSNEALLQADLDKGKIAGIVNIVKNSAGNGVPYLLKFRSTTASSDKYPQFLSTVNAMIGQVSNTVYPGRPSYARIDMRAGDIAEVREYKTIDFILPGQLGFSLLSAGVFGVAFIFFSLRQTLVLKRFFATPIKRTYIILGESISRVLFQLLTAIVILAIGHLAFGFTLVHGFLTFMELLILSLVGLLVFMGFGFIVSSVAKNENTIPPFANLFTLPQFLLAGTFFSIDVFPSWLQPICRMLPLTHLNDAMRKVAFEGAHLTDCGKQLGVLGLWGVVLYAIAVKVFRWE